MWERENDRERQRTTDKLRERQNDSECGRERLIERDGEGETKLRERQSDSECGRLRLIERETGKDRQVERKTERAGALMMVY